MAFGLKLKYRLTNLILFPILDMGYDILEYGRPWVLLIAANIIIYLYVIIIWFSILGLHHLNDSSNYAISNTYRVSRLVVHENYKQKNPNFDIALIELEKPVTKSPLVRSICLPNATVKPESIVDRYAVVAGWGRSNPYSRPDTQRNLQHTVLKIINGHKLCSKHLQSFDYTNLYCAHDTNEKRNSNVCIGDRYNKD